MKNVKKILVLAAMLSVLCALMCVNAFAAGGTIESITPAENSGANFTVAQDPVKFDMTYTAAQDGMFLVLVVDSDVPTNGGKIAPQAGDILYVNQTTSVDNLVSFTAAGENEIYPSGIENGSQIYLAGAGLDQLTLMGTISTPEPTIVYGDVDNSGKVNSRDATALRKYFADKLLYPLAVEAAGDVDGSGKVNSRDATALRKYLADKLLYPLPVTQK